MKMFARCFSFFLAFFAVSFSAIATEEETFTEGCFQYTIDERNNSAVRISAVNRADQTMPFPQETTLSIPGNITHNGRQYAVESIAINAFSWCNNLENLVIGEGVKFINDGAFACCRKLRSIYLSSTVEHVSAGAFEGCTNLKRIVVDEKNESFDSRNNCNAIIEKDNKTLVLGCRATTIPSDVKHIGDGAFKGCLWMESFTIPEGITEIGSLSFADCANLQQVSLPTTLETIDELAFFNCTALRHVFIPRNVNTIAAAPPFVGCLRLDSITVDPENKTYDSRNGCNAIIETATDKLIAGCRNTHIVEGIREIGKSAFGDSGLREITIPASVTKIDKAFWGCALCTSIKVDRNNPIYDSRDECNAIIETATDKLIAGCTYTQIPNSVKEIGASAFSGLFLPTQIVLPEGIKAIGEQAFAGCKSLERIFIPKSVEELGPAVFFQCKDLFEVHWEGHTEEIPGSTFANCPNLSFIEIPQGTKTIQYSAFEKCQNLRYVSLPSSLEHIHNTAFKGCPCDSLVQQKHQDIISTKRL